MLIQTDERYVPWSDDLCTGYEHIHRYIMAQQHTINKTVLDLACGEGYGSAFLAKTAKKVVGIDICKEAIQHASERYQHPNLFYRTGSILNPPVEHSELFDVIVCFEALEHIAEQEALLQEVKKLLKNDGIFIVSTPNKPIYSENGTRQNPYHVKELDFNEFESLLKKNFKNWICYGHKTYAASKIFPIHFKTNTVDEYRIVQNKTGFEISDIEDQYPRYFIAVASDQELAYPDKNQYLTDVSFRKGYIKWEHTQKDGADHIEYKVSYISTIVSKTISGLTKFLQKSKRYLGQIV